MKKTITFLVSLIFLVSMIVIPVNAEGVTINSLKASIDVKTKVVTISGVVEGAGGEKQVTIKVMDPEGNNDFIYQVTSAADGNFNVTYTTASKVIGTYTVKIGAAGMVNPASVTFNYADPGNGSLTIDMFKDMNHWSKKYVSRMLEKGFISGYNERGVMTIKPDRQISRAEILCIVCRAAGLQPSKNITMSYKDKASIPNWAVGYVQTAFEKGIIKDCYNGQTFLPSKSVTRAEMVTIVMNAFAFGKATENIHLFKDSLSIPSWAKGFVGKAYDLGLSKGYSDNTFKPNNSVTRAEACVIIMNSLDLKQ